MLKSKSEIILFERNKLNLIKIHTVKAEATKENRKRDEQYAYKNEQQLKFFFNHI